VLTMSATASTAPVTPLLAQQPTTTTHSTSSVAAASQTPPSSSTPVAADDVRMPFVVPALPALGMINTRLSAPVGVLGRAARVGTIVLPAVQTPADPFFSSAAPGGRRVLQMRDPGGSGPRPQSPGSPLGGSMLSGGSAPAGGGASGLLLVAVLALGAALAVPRICRWFGQVASVMAGRAVLLSERPG
jgi:uncharacterized membrane protein YgcG